MSRTIETAAARYAEALVELGAKLTAARTDAGLTQQQLADGIGCARITIGRAEAGKRLSPLTFWRTADHHLHSSPALATAAARVIELRQAADAQRAADVARHEAAQDCLDPSECLCRIAIPSWTAREIRALRTALRYGFADWALFLRTDVATVLAWERPATPPRLKDQTQFDDLLAQMPLDARARFRILLAASRQRRSLSAPAAPLSGLRCADTPSLDCIEETT